MARVKLTAGRAGQVASGWGSVVEVNGTPMTEVTEVTLSAGVDGPVRVDLSMHLNDEFVFEDDVYLNVNLVLPEGYDAVMEDRTVEGVKQRLIKAVRRCD